MYRSRHQEKFSSLRRQFPVFTFESFDYRVDERGLSVTYHFDLSGQHHFSPTVFVPASPWCSPASLSAPDAENLLFHIGMVELVSYWKAACPPPTK